MKSMIKVRENQTFVVVPLDKEVPQIDTLQLITLTGFQVSPLEQGFDEAEYEFNVLRANPITATAMLSLPSQPGEKFRVPMLRTDTGRTDYFVAVVNENGDSITISGQFATGGCWVTNNELINQEFSEPMFEMPELRFMVL